MARYGIGAHGLWTLACAAVLAGCASSHNFKTDGFNALGGGFADDEIRPGLYRLMAIANKAPWPSFSAAKGTWERRADQLCGPGKYREIETMRQDGFGGTTTVYRRPGQMIDLPHYNASISGYILCDSAGMTVPQAIAYLDELAETQRREAAIPRERELAELGGPDCAGSAADVTADNLYRRGQLLSDLGNYQPALACLTKAQERAAPDSTTYRNSCVAIGTMYELGWGVKKDVPVAMEWFKKGGL